MSSTQEQVKSSRAKSELKREANMSRIVSNRIQPLSYISPTPPIDHINNHTHVWGSFFGVNTRQWGYACCHSTIQASYCTGQAGIEAAKASSAGEMLKKAAQRSEAQKEQEKAAQTNGDSTLSKKRLGEGDLNLDKDRLAQALSAERKRKVAGEDDDERWGGKRRKYGVEGTNMDVTEEDLGNCLLVVFNINLLTHERRSVSNQSTSRHGRSDVQLQGY
jgi:hypothetical protein